jgi:putative tryptophan/tyrosine transport system substrate-binding protein
MHRRDFIKVVAGSAAAWPFAARAQQPPIPVMGYLSSAAERSFRVYLDAFRAGLRETGYVEDRNVRIEYRWANGQYSRLWEFASDLVNRKVALIATAGGNPPAQAAKAATSTIPIVFVSGGDPVAGGLVESFNRPGGNVTGISWVATALLPKRLDFLRQLVGSAAKIGALVNPSFDDSAIQLRELEQSGKEIGQEITIVKAASPEQLDTVFALLKQQTISALIVANDPFFAGSRDQIVTLAARYNVPTMYFIREFAVAGGLISYGSSLIDANRQCGVYVGKILSGAKPADLPVLQPTKFELVINLKAAKTLGLKIPPGMLAVADEVIE